MNSLQSWLKSLRQYSVALFLGIFLLVGTVLGYGNAAQAARGTNPLDYRESYQVNQQKERASNWDIEREGNKSNSRNADLDKYPQNPNLVDEADQGTIDNTRNKLKSAAANVRNRLNLDEANSPNAERAVSGARDRTKNAIEGAKQTFKGATKNLVD